MIRLFTDRLLIRDHLPEDLPTHHTLYSSETVMRYLPSLRTQTLEASRAHLQGTMEAAAAVDRKTFYFRMETGASRAHVGEIGYHVTGMTQACKQADAGYFLYEACWGRGYATEALAEVLRFAFIEGGIDVIRCGCLKENAASEAVMRKCGMIKERELRQIKWHEGKLKDRVIYRLLRQEWEERHCSAQIQGKPELESGRALQPAYHEEERSTYPPFRMPATAY